MSAVRPSRLPLGMKWRSHKNFITFAVAVAVFTDIFLYGLIVPVFPFSLEHRAGVAHDDVQRWTSALLAVYGGGLLAASPICGYIADRTSARMAPFIVGLIALAGATVLLCIGSNIAVLVVGRLLQGVSAAVVWVVGLALLADTAGKNNVGEAMGNISLALSLGMFAGPLLGGVVYERAGYSSVFAMAFALIGIDIILRVLIIEPKPKDAPDNNAPNSITPSADADAEAPTDSDDFSSTKPDRVASSSPRPGFWHRLGLRMPPVITLLRHPRLLWALWGSMVQAILMTSFETTVPLFVHETFGWTSTAAGLIFLALIVPTFFAPLIGKVCDRYGPRGIASFGFVFGTPFLVLLRIVDERSTREIVVFCVLLVLAGVALTFVITPFLAEITLVIVDLEDKVPGRFGPHGAFAQAYGLFNIAFAGGSLIGPLLAGFLKESNGWKTLTLVLGVLCGVSAIPTMLYTGGKLQMIDLDVKKLLKRRDRDRTNATP